MWYERILDGPWLPALLGLLLCLAGGTAAAQSCQLDDVCVVPERIGEQVHFYVVNESDAARLVTVGATLHNMRPDVPLPRAGTFAAGTRTRVFTLTVEDPRRAWNYQFRYRWRPTRTCGADGLCIRIAQHGPLVHFYAANRQPYHVGLQLWPVDGDAPVPPPVDPAEQAPSTPAVADIFDTAAPLPFFATCPPRTEQLLFSARLRDLWQPWAYQFRWQTGAFDVRGDEVYAYALPYAAGTAHPVTQGFGGAFSHQDRHAVDWAMPEGTPVHAARPGIVVAVQDTHTVSGLEPWHRTRGNYVEVAHADGTLARYFHLRPRGVAVAPGEAVRRGQLLGYSGNTGYSRGPHLHFEVVTLTQAFTYRTLPVRFVTGRGAVGIPQEGDVLEAYGP